MSERNFCRGFEADEPKTSGFFKLQKIRTGKRYVPTFLINMGMQGIDSRPFALDACRA